MLGQANLLIPAASLTLALTAPAIAAELPSEAGAYLEQEMTRKVPQNWQVHVSRHVDVPRVEIAVLRFGYL